MTQEDLFSDEPTHSAPPELEDKDYFSELVGEGRKYADPQTLARSRIEADRYIEQLKTENAGLREDLGSRIKLEEFVDRLNQREPPQAPQPQDGEGRRVDDTAVTPEDLDRIVDTRLTEREKAASRKQNLAKTKAELQKQLGPNYASKVKEIGSGLGLGEAFLNDVAATSPDAFLKLVGLTEQPRQELFEAPPRSNVNTAGFKPQGSAKNFAYYEALRKKDPNTYWRPTTQNEMFREAHAQQEAFYK